MSSKKTLLFLLLIVLLSGCQTMHSGQHYYLHRHVAKIAVLPPDNKVVEHPDASIIFNKASEEALMRKGFVVIPADSAVTYAAANQISISELQNLNSTELGKSLGADFLLYSILENWEHQYSVAENRILVSGRCWIIETSTGALIWLHEWKNEIHTVPDQRNDALQRLLNVALAAIVDSAFDRLANLGQQAAHQSIQTAPNPGFQR